MNRLFLICFCLPCFIMSVAKGQGIDEYAAKSYLRHGNAEGYISPLINLVGASMHTSSLSYRQTDSLHKFNFYIGVTATAAFIPEDMKSFQGVTEAPFSPTRTVTAPTIFGENNTSTIYDESGNAYTFPPGFETKQINLAFPVIHIGTIFHTNLSGRFFALDLGGDIKKIQLFSIGINHFISDYWYAEDYYVTLGGSYHQYKLGAYMKGKHLMAQLSAGQRFGSFNYWAFAQWQKSPHEFNYEDELEGNGVVKIDGPAVVRTGVGCGIQLWKFYIHAEGSGFKPIIGALGIGLQF